MKLFLLCLILLLCALAFNEASSQHPANTENKRDSLLQVAYSISSPNDRLDYFLNISENSVNAQFCVIFAENAISLADSINITFKKGLAFRESGRAWKKWGNKEKAEERLSAAIEIFSSLDSTYQLHQAYRDLGETFRATRSYYLAESYFNRALKYFTAIGDSLEMAKTYNRLAANQFEKITWGPNYGNFERDLTSKEYTREEALQRYQPIKLAFDTLLIYLNTSNQLLNPKDNHELYVSNAIIQGAYYNYSFQQDKAIEILEGLISHPKGLNVDDLSLTYINLAQIHEGRFLDNPEKVVYYGELGLKFAQQSKINTYEHMANKVLSENYLHLGNYKKAYEHLRNTLRTREAFYDTDLILKLRARSLEYDLTQRGTELENKRTQLFIVVAALGCILLIFTVLVTIIMMNNNKQRKLLKELNTKNHLISQQIDQLAKLNAEKDKYFSIIGHDLRGPTANILQLSQVLKNMVHGKQYEEVPKMADWIESAAQNSLLLLTDLTSWAKSQSDRLEINKHPLSLKEALREPIDYSTSSAKQKNISISLDMQDDLWVETDPNLLKTVLRNLLSNAVKFTPPHGSISISAEPTDSWVTVAIADSGIGMSEELQNKLFQLTNEKIRPSTEGEKSTGLGLLLVKEFVEKQGGTLRVESEVDRGTTFYFTLPAASSPEQE